MHTNTKKILSVALALGSCVAMFSCSGNLKPEPPKTVKDPSMVALYKKAISGDVKSLRAISEQYRNGTNGFPQNARQAANALYMAANAGDTQSQLELARCYENGYGRLANRKTAMGWYYKAGQQGSKLGKQKYEEISTQLAEEEAARQREAAANRSQGSGSANTMSDEEMYNYAVQHANTSTPQGVEMLTYLGAALYGGIGCRQNVALGIQYLRQAAQLGNSKAQQALRAGGLSY